MPHFFYNAETAWEGFRQTLGCVDEKSLKIAFCTVWDARGDVDKEAASAFKHDHDHPKMLRRLDELDKPPWD